jgi:hypothetical protein
MLHRRAMMAGHVVPGRMVLMPRQRRARLVAHHPAVAHGAAAAHRLRSRTRHLGMRVRGPVTRMRRAAMRALVMHMRGLVMRMARLAVRTHGRMMMAERDPAMRGPHPRHRRERGRRLGFGLRFGRRRRRNFGRGLLLRRRQRLFRLLRVRVAREHSKRQRCAHHHGTMHEPLHQLDDSRVERFRHPLSSRARPTRCTACRAPGHLPNAQAAVAPPIRLRQRGFAVAHAPAIVQLGLSLGEGKP